MTRFDKVKFVKALKTLPFPVAHTVFLEPQTAPYLIYTDDEFEEITETFLDDFTTYEKSRSYISEEQLYITYYSFDL